MRKRCKHHTAVSRPNDDCTRDDDDKDEEHNGSNNTCRRKAAKTTNKAQQQQQSERQITGHPCGLSQESLKAKHGARGVGLGVKPIICNLLKNM